MKYFYNILTRIRFVENSIFLKTFLYGPFFFTLTHVPHGPDGQPMRKHINFMLQARSQPIIGRPQKHGLSPEKLKIIKTPIGPIPLLLGCVLK